MSLIRSLPAGPLDVVGDIHGEGEHLDALLYGLGYRDDGSHPQGRTLVFVGDLVDRGPDSLGVSDRTQHLVDQGAALCVLGNHEINLLRGHKKEGAHWFFGEPEQHRASGATFRSRLAGKGDRGRMLRFWRGLPLGLERSDLRVVHAAWSDHPELRSWSDPVAAWAHWDRQVDQALRSQGWLERRKMEQLQHDITDRTVRPPVLEATGHVDVQRQVGNPGRILASGLEERAPVPFWSSGKWRMSRRVPWWRTYAGPTVLFGHYWRKVPGTPQDPRKLGPDLFEGEPPFGWMGRGNAMCLDYSVGRLFLERHIAPRGPHFGRLAALRCPAEGERDGWALHFTNGRILLPPPNVASA